MAPRPENEPDGYRVLSTLMSMISSFLGYSKPSLRKEPKEIVNIMDQPVPPIPDTPPLIPSKVPIPTPWELPTAGPEKEPWLGIPELKGTDDYAELTKNPWSYKQKRSIEDGEPLQHVMGLGQTGMATPVQLQQLEGRPLPACSTELSLFVFILLVMVTLGGFTIWRIGKTEKKLCRRIDYLGELRQDEEE